MIKTIIFGAIVGFIVTLLSTPIIIRFFRRIGLTVTDIHKQNKPLVVRSAGIPVMAGVFMSTMLFIFISRFFYDDQSLIINLFGFVTTVLLITFAGFFDDLATIQDKSAYKDKESKLRLKQWQKPLLVLPALIPLIVISAGESSMNVPLFGDINFGILYPLLLVPIGILGAANMINNLEGLNGLSSGMGIVYTGMLGLYSYINNSQLGAIISFSTFGALLAIWKFHKTPARILAGDSLTYLLGAVLASIAILGNMEKAALICAIPFFIEFALKLRGKLKKETIGYVDKNNKIHSKYNKIYSLPHIWMRTGKYTEKQIVYFLILVELFFSSLIWII
jgi:UDP-N-acetylglucosamine--dolichyl-phosphate N-acetylglucosaminephosphotransferase